LSDGDFINDRNMSLTGFCQLVTEWLVLAVSRAVNSLVAAA